MDKPTLIPAGWTLTRKLAEGALELVVGASIIPAFVIAMMAYLLAIIAILLSVAGPCMLLAIEPFQIIVGLAPASHAPIYAASCLLSYAAMLALSLIWPARLRCVPVPPDAKLLGALAAPFDSAAEALRFFIAGIFSRKILGRDGLLAAFPLGGWKVALFSAAWPLHVALLLLFSTPLWASRMASLARSSMPTRDGLEETMLRWAHESPELLARQEAKALAAEAAPGSASYAPPRL